MLGPGAGSTNVWVPQTHCVTLGRGYSLSRGGSTPNFKGNICDAKPSFKGLLDCAEHMLVLLSGGAVGGGCGGNVAIIK